jgi:glutathione S-transferase
MPWPFSAMARRIAGTVQGTFIGPQLKRHLDFMEAELAAHPWFAGKEFTAADIQMSFPLEAAASRAGLDARRPKLFAFLDRIHARDAYKRALERGGPYRF